MVVPVVVGEKDVVVRLVRVESRELIRLLKLEMTELAVAVDNTDNSEEIKEEALPPA